MTSACKALGRVTYKLGPLSVVGSCRRCSEIREKRLWNIRYEEGGKVVSEKEGGRTLPLVKSVVSTDLIIRLGKDLDFSWKGIKTLFQEFRDLSHRYDQRFIPERLQILGSDLAAAHFIIYRGGAVRFLGETEWRRKDEKDNYDLPTKFVKDIYVEAIDLEGVPILYEGLDVINNLQYLRWLSLRHCGNVDDWFCDRLGQFRNSLEYLDISGCERVTDRGVSVLHRLGHLKRLKLDKLPNVKHRELLCILLEDALPQCQISGIDYTSLLLDVPTEGTADFKVECDLVKRDTKIESA